MNLAQLRNEVLNHGFDPVLFPQGRIDTYINDAYLRILARVKWYGDEASQPVVTVAGASSLSWPADIGDVRALVNTDNSSVLTQCALSDIDAASASSGRPTMYAVDGRSLRLYPTPNGPYNLLLRYWRLPATLTLDTDAPVIPLAWHRLLWYWGCKEAYASEDDAATSQYWEAQFNSALAEYAADVKFPSEFPLAAESMWAV